MSRPGLQRSVFVGAAWFAVLLSLCVAALDPSLIEHVLPRARSESPHRAQRRLPRADDRVTIAEQPGRTHGSTEPGGVAPQVGDVPSRLTAKPAPGDALPHTPIERAPDPRSGPILPPPDVAAVTSPPRLPAPLRGLDAPTELDVEIIAPVSAIEGEPAPFAIRIRNATAIPADGVTLTVAFDERWELPGSDDLSVEQRLGTIPAGEARDVTIALRPLQSGALSADFRLASATHSARTQSARADVDPRLVDFAIAGPRRKSVGQRAEFVLTVQNVSDGDLPDARVDVDYDTAALAVREASTGCVARDGALQWPLGTLFRGERVQIQIEYECLLESPRTPIGGAFSSAGRVLRASGANLDIVPACLLDVSIVDLDDPWNAGEPAQFRITAVNRGTTPISDLQLRVSPSPHFDKLSLAVTGEKSGVEVTQDAYGALIRVTSFPAGRKLELVAGATCALPGPGVLRVLAQSPSLPAPFEVEESAVVNIPHAAP